MHGLIVLMRGMICLDNMQTKFFIVSRYARTNANTKWFASIDAEWPSEFLQQFLISHWQNKSRAELFTVWKKKKIYWEENVENKLQT